MTCFHSLLSLFFFTVCWETYPAAIYHKLLFQRSADKKDRLKRRSSQNARISQGCKYSPHLWFFFFVFVLLLLFFASWYGGEIKRNQLSELSINTSAINQALFLSFWSKQTHFFFALFSFVYLYFYFQRNAFFFYDKDLVIFSALVSMSLLQYQLIHASNLWKLNILCNMRVSPYDMTYMLGWKSSEWDLEFQ